MELRRDHPRRGRCGSDGRGDGGPVGRPGGARDRPCREARQEDPHLGRGQVQLHQHRHGSRKTSCPRTCISRNPRSAATPSGIFLDLRRTARHRLAREDAGAIVLRRLGAPDRRHAGGGMPQREAPRSRLATSHRRDRTWRRAVPGRGCHGAPARDRDGWPLRSRRWERPVPPTTSPGASVSTS